MADIAMGRLRAILTMDDKQFRKQFRSVDRLVAQQSRRFRTLGRNLSRTLTLPILAAGAAITATAVNFDREMKRVRALTGATGSQFKALEDQAKSLGRTTAFSASQAAEGMAFLAQAGFNAEKILATLSGTLSLAAAGQVELARAADIASNVLQAFRLEASQMGRVGDVLAKTFSSSNTNLEQLADGMKLLAPTANALGMSVEQTSAAIGLLGDAGLQGTIAGTSLNQALLAVVDTSGTAEKVVQRLGIALRDQSGNLLPLVDILAQLEEKTVSVQEVIQIFGIRGGRAINTLVGRSAELRKFTEELERAGGTAKRLAEEQLEGLFGALVRLKSATEGAALAIADAGLSNLVESIAGALTKFAQHLAELDEETRRSIVSIGLLAAAVGPLLVVLGALGFALAPIVAALVALAPLIGTGGAVLAGLGLMEIAAGSAAFGWSKLKDAMRETESAAEDLRKRFDELEPVAEKVDKAIGLRARLLEVQAEFRIAFEERAPKEALDALIQERKELEVRLQILSDEQGPLKVGMKIEVTPKAAGVDQFAAAAVALAKAQEELQRQFAVLEAQAELFGDSFELAAEKASVLRGTIEELTEKGVKPASPALRKMAADLKQLEAQAARAEGLEQIEQVFENMHDQLDALNLDPLTLQLQKQRDALLDYAEAAGIAGAELDTLVEQFDSLAAQIRNEADARDAQRALEEPFRRAAENIQREFGNIFTDIFRKGVSSFKDLGNRVLDIFTRLAGEIATLLIFRPQVLAAGGVGGVLGGLFGAPQTAGAGTTGTGTGVLSFLGNLGGALSSLVFGGQMTGTQQQAIINITGGGAFSGAVLNVVQGGITGQAIQGGAIGGAISGVLSGFAFGTGTGGGSTGERIGGAIGSIVGSAVGAIFGGPIGAQLGGVIGNYAVGQTGRAIGNIVSTGQFFSPGMSRLQQAQLAAFAPFGATMFEPRFNTMERIGWTTLDMMTGGLFGQIASLLGFFDRKTHVQLRTAAEFTGAPEAFQDKFALPGPFGFVGFEATGTTRFPHDLIEQVSEFFVSIDEMVAEMLRPAEIALAATALQTTDAMRNTFRVFDGEIAELLKDRLETIIDAIVREPGYTRGIDLFKAIPMLPESTEDLVAAAGQWLTERNAVIELLDQLRSFGEPEIKAEAAIAEVEALIEQIRLAAPAYRVRLTDLPELREAALGRLTEGFEEGIARSLMMILDPFTAAMDDLVLAQAQRVREAETLGADLVELERLSLLERERLLENYARSAKDLLLALTAGPQSPLAPTEVLAAAEARFEELRTAVLGGDLGQLDALVAAAENLIVVSQQVLASSEHFFERFNFVVATLENITSQASLSLPGFASGGSFTVPALGGSDNVVPLFRASSGELVTITPASQVGRQERILQEIGRSITGGNEDLVEELQELRRENQALRAVLERQQMSIERLARRKAS